MSAPRTILLGTALGLAAGAVTLAQDSGTPMVPDATYVAGADAGHAPDRPTESGLIYDANTLASAATETPLPEGDGLAVTARELLGTRVYDVNREWVGEVSALIPAATSRDPRVVIDIGGFLGFGETPVAVPADDVTVAWTDAGEIAYATVALTEAQLEQMAQAQG